MKNRIGFWALGLLLASMLLMPQAQAWGQACTNATFSGTYVFNDANIVILFGDAVYLMTADGAGKFTFQAAAYAKPLFPSALVPAATVGTAPSVLPQSPAANEVGRGSYSVNADCTMTLIFNPSNFNCFDPSESPTPCDFPIHFDAVLVKGGAGFYAAATDPPTAASGAGVRQ